MESLRKPPRVQRGDTVAVVSPSAGGVALWLHRFERGKQYLESLGLAVRLMPNAARAEGWVSAPPEARAEDLREAFLADDVAVVLCGIGGTHSNLPSWTDELLDWNVKADLARAREVRESEGWITAREGSASGLLLGGTLESICWHLKGSQQWIDPAGAILFLEMSEEAPSPAHVDAYLTDLEQLGVFDDAVAIVFARPYGYSPERARVLWEVVARRTERAGIPVLANVDAGHADPMISLAIGCRAHPNAGEKRLELLEPPTADHRD